MMNPIATSRLAIRRLRRSPGYSLSAIVTLGLGIFAMTLVHAFVDAIWFRPLDYHDPQRLVAVFQVTPSRGTQSDPMSAANFTDLAQYSKTVTSITAATPFSPIREGSESHRWVGLKSTSALFDLLAREPALGRTFRSSDGDDVLVIGHRLWQREFGSREDVIGQAVVLDEKRYEIVGVMPEGFYFPPFWHERAEFWVPAVWTPEQASERGTEYLRVFGRLRDDASLAQARSEFQGVWEMLVERYPTENQDSGVRVTRLKDPVIAPARAGLALLLSAGLTLLLIASANVASMAMVRVESHRRQSFVRRALGARALALWQDWFAEAVCIGAGAGLVGWFLASWSVEAFIGWVPDTFPRHSELGYVRLDVAAWLLASLTSLSGYFFFGWLAVGGRERQRVSPAEHSPRAVFFRRSLVVAQISLSTCLLLSTGLLVRSLLRLMDEPVGYASEQLLSTDLVYSATDQGQPPAQSLLLQRLVESVTRVDSVSGVALTNHLPLGGDMWMTPFATTLSDERDPVPPRAVMRTVSPGYFEVMGIRLLMGDGFEWSDDLDNVLVVAVNATLARQYLGDEPVGEMLRIGSASEPRRIVAVAADVHQWDLSDSVRPEIYFPYGQNPTSFFMETSLVVRSGHSPERVAPSVRDAVMEVDPRVAITRQIDLSTIVSQAFRTPRFQAFTIGGIALLSLVLSMTGIFALVSHLVRRRRREIGLRMALGASQTDVRHWVLGHGLVPVVKGLALGVVAGLILARQMSSLLYGISFVDPTSLVLVVAVVLLAGAGSLLIPAQRAARLTPRTILHED